MLVHCRKRKRKKSRKAQRKAKVFVTAVVVAEVVVKVNPNSAKPLHHTSLQECFQDLTNVICFSDYCWFLFHFVLL